jgi:hypothetical protein
VRVAGTSLVLNAERNYYQNIHVECGALIRMDRVYVMIRAKWHPRSKSNNGYVFEHILVMEKKIGRFLTGKETVHHKYGIKDDNHPDHLELWSGSHPAGCRVDDLVEFSIATLKKYAPELLKNTTILYSNYITLGSLSS